MRPPPCGPCHAPGRRGSRRPSPASRGAGRFNPGPRSAVHKRRAGAALGRRHIAGRLIGPREPFRLLIKSRILSSEKLTANMPPTHSGRQRHTGGGWGGGPRGAVSTDGTSSELRGPSARLPARAQRWRRPLQGPCPRELNCDPLRKRLPGEIRTSILKGGVTEALVLCKHLEVEGGSAPRHQRHLRGH